MAKKKKSKVIQMPKTVEAQIRTRARNLEIGSCYISEDWEEARQANIIVSRTHSNGNISFAVFLVDLAATGVKDAIYDFNISDYEFNENITKNIESGSLVKTDYELVHNIIYGAVEYAEDLGLMPCKTFATAKFILEDDDERIPLIDIEFGVNGSPALFTTSENPMLKEIKQLEESVGDGNFKIFYNDFIEDEDYDHNLENEEDNDDFFDEIFEGLMPGWDDDLEEIGVFDWNEDDWKKYMDIDEAQPSFRVLQYMVDMVFLDMIDDMDSFETVLGEARQKNENDNSHNLNDIELIAELYRRIKDEDRQETLNFIEESINKNPNILDLRIIALTYKAETMSFEAIVNEYEELRKTFGTNLSYLESYANFLFTNDKEDQIPELINNSVTLSDFEPNRDYSDSEIIDFCKIHAYYFLAKNLIFEIEPYYQVLDTLEDGNPETRLLIQDIVLRKLELIQDINDKLKTTYKKD